MKHTCPNSHIKGPRGRAIQKQLRVASISLTTLAPAHYPGIPMPFNQSKSPKSQLPPSNRTPGQT